VNFSGKDPPRRHEDTKRGRKKRKRRTHGGISEELAESTEPRISVMALLQTRYIAGKL
jgi:hypothetical protein